MNMITSLIGAGVWFLCFFLGIVLTFGTEGFFQNIGCLFFFGSIISLLLIIIKIIFFSTALINLSTGLIFVVGIIFVIGIL